MKTKLDLPVLGNTDADLYNQKDILHLNLQTGSPRHEPTRFLHVPEVKWGGNMIIPNRIRHHVSPFPVNIYHCSKNFWLCAMTPIVTGFQKPNGDQLKCQDSCKKIPCPQKESKLHFTGFVSVYLGIWYGQEFTDVNMQ